MANIGFVKRKHKVFKDEEVSAALDDINRTRFDGKLTITRDHGNWVISFGYSSFFLWIETRRTIAIHPPGGAWMEWVCSVVSNDLSVRFDGTISDEGVEETWRGEPGKYPTIDDYFYSWYVNESGMTAERKEEILKTRQSLFPELPECFRNRKLTYL